MDSVDNIQTDIRNTQTFESQTEIRKEKFQIVNLMCLIYAIGIAIISQIGDISYFIVGKKFKNFLRKNRENCILIGTLVINQIFGSLIMFLLTKFIKKIKIERKKYGYKKYIANLIINSGLLVFGSILGYFINFGFVFTFSKNKNSTNEQLEQFSSGSFSKSNKFLNFFVVCISAPIAEEFIFRKCLIDRLAIYSKTLAIFASGIIFGVFHNNIHQFFGTMLLGWSLAYSYVETGNILIPISYHMIENSYTTIAQMLTLTGAKGHKILQNIGVGILFVRFIEALTGIILLIVKRKKIKVTGEENKSGDKWKLFKSYGMWIFIFEGFILFSLLYMNIIFVSVEPVIKNSKLFFLY